MVAECQEGTLTNKGDVPTNASAKYETHNYLKQDKKRRYLWNDLKGANFYQRYRFFFYLRISLK